MTANQSADHSRLMAMAAAISDGTPINWAETTDTDPETTSVIGELRMIEHLARLSDPMPGQWGPFVIRGEIGRGSYGTVYRALDRQLDIEVALKVIRPRALEVAIDPSHALTEARLLRRMRRARSRHRHGAGEGPNAARSGARAGAVQCPRDHGDRPRCLRRP